MLDRVAVSVEQRCVPIAQGLVPFCTVKRQADIAARKVELRVLSGHQNHRRLRIRAMMASTRFGHVDDRRVVEYGAISLGNGLELGHQGPDLLHVMGLDGISHFRSARNLAAMPNLVDTRFLLIFRQGGDVGAQVVNGVGNDIGQSRRECSYDDIGEGGLLLGKGCICATISVDRVNVRQVLFNLGAQ